MGDKSTATLPAKRPPMTSAICKRPSKAHKSPLEDVCVHVPHDNDPEELYMVRMLNPVFAWPQEFDTYMKELCRGLEQ